MIVQMLGKPASYLKEALEIHLSKLNHFKGVEVLSKNFSEPKSLEENNEIFSSFCEIELKVDSFEKVLDLIFELMPNSIEILEPSEINLDLYEATMILNSLAGKLHRYEDALRVAYAKMKMLSDSLNMNENSRKGSSSKKSKKKVPS